VDDLRVCYYSLGAEKASGVDGVTKAEYGKNLEENLRNLPVQLKRKFSVFCVSLRGNPIGWPENYCNLNEIVLS
jgi:hypothetical protein